MIINVNTLKPGITFLHNAIPHYTLDANHSKSGRGQAHVKVKAKNLFNNSIINITFTGGTKIETAHIDKIKMNFLYKDNKEYYFMNNETFEQLPIQEETIKEQIYFIKEDIEILILKYKNQIIGINLPDKVSLKVVEVEQAVKGDTTSGATKKAILETGLEIMVPIFIKENEYINVKTLDSKYDGRSN